METKVKHEETEKHRNIYEQFARGRTPPRVKATKGTLQEHVESVPRASGKQSRMRSIDQFDKGSRERIRILANPISLTHYDSVPGDCIDLVVSTKSEERLFTRNVQLHVRLPKLF